MIVNFVKKNIRKGVFMKKQVKRFVSYIVTLCVLCTCFSGLSLSVSAAGNVSVNIVSFTRGEQADLRSSELLEARVEGYDGNVRELTYEWTNEIGTYLYVYNNHNMYGIDGTDGEVEIYNDEVDASANMAGRTYNKTFAGEGFAWAAIYGANYDNSDLLGTITVTVKDANGNVLATDSHTGTRSGRWGRYTYSGFITDSLESDLQAISFGIFEGDSKHIRELFSESSITHITCTAASVSNPKVSSGKDYISLTKGEEDHYIVEALKPGKSEISMTIEKDNCKFHQNSSGKTTTTVYVYKRPVPTPTTTTITLSSLDEHCTYYIDGQQGKKQSDGTIIFEGLTPNTTYTIEAQGQAEGTEVVYAYTQATTLPVFSATVMVYLDGGYNIDTATAYGTLINIDTIRATENDLYVKDINGGEFIELVNTSTGVYTAGLPNGTYNIYRDAKDASKISDQHLDINNEGRTRYLFYYSVSYDANGGEGTPATEHIYKGDTAYASNTVPTKSGYSFAGWKDADGNVYQPGDVITEDIEKPYVLTAVWKELADVYVNIKIDHISQNGRGHNNDNGKHDITFTVDAREQGSTGDYTELVSKTIDWDGVSAFNMAGYTSNHSINGNTSDITTYTATAPTFENIPAGMEYTFTSNKSGYTLKNVSVTTKENGDVVIDAELVYDPNTFDLVFNVELDEAAKKRADELKPIAANVKVTGWFDSPYVDGEAVAWNTITAHHDTYIKVDIGTDGTGTGTFPVSKATTDTNTPYNYRIEVVSYVLPDGTVMDAKDVDNAHEYYTTEDERYTAYIEVTGGKDPNANDSNTLKGVWFANDKQNGEVTAIISIETFDVTLKPNGGKFADDTTANKVLKEQLAVPSLTDYTPVRDGGYTFVGWYLADSKGNITDTTVSEGDTLKNDITLIAKWADPLTVKGTVSVAGTYELKEKSTHIILDADRIKTAKVLIQRIDANGYPVTIDSADVAITYTNDMGTGQYEFSNIPDDGHDYRIKAIEVNYGESYQNELSSSTTVTDYHVYDDAHYKAEFNGDNTAVVNAYLPFKPVVFDLDYKIDATAIAEGFRPEGVETFVLYDDGQNGTTPQHWGVISQMLVDGVVNGQDTALTEGIGEDSYPVWEGNPSKLYDYGIRVDKYTSAGSEKVYDEQADPFRIYYNGSARFSSVNGQTQLLTATLVPKMYTIIFDTASGDDAINNMDDYLSTTGNYEDTYYWSYGKTITAKPIRQNYRFLGWYDADGNKVTEIAPDKAQTITLTARWEEVESYVNNYAYIFGYNDSIMGAEGPLLRSEVSAMIHRLVKQNGKLGGFVYNEADTPDFSDIGGEWFRSGIEYINYKGSFTVEEGGMIQPYAQVTRGEAFKHICIGLSFTDDTTQAVDWYANFLYECGYIEGDENGDLNVGGYITRAEFCTMYNRIIGRAFALLEDKNGNEITAQTYGFTDLSGEEWYYDEMIKATSAYDDNGFVDISLRGIRNNLDDYNG